MTKINVRRAGAAAITVAGACAALAAPAMATTEPLLALDTSERVTAIDAGGNALSAPTPIQGLAADENAVDLDYVPSLDRVVLLTDKGTVYSLSNRAVASPISEATVGSVPTAMDYNPTTNPQRLRIFSGAMNFRALLPEKSYVADGTVALTGANIVGAAYTNNDTDPATGTTLLTIDATTDALYAHAGAPQFNAMTKVGDLGVNADAVSEFDISGATGTAYAALRNGELDSSLYTVNLTTGAATKVAKIAGGGLRVTGLTAVPAAFLPPKPVCGQEGGEQGLLSLPVGNVSRVLGSRQGNAIGGLVSTVNCTVVAPLGL
jgi:hypothetical protein